MDQGDDEKRVPHPLDLQEGEEDEQHPAAAPGLPSYQEATSEPRQPPPAYLAPGSPHTPGADHLPTAPFLDEKRRAHPDEAPPPSSSPPGPSSPEPSLQYTITVQNAALQQQKRILIQPAAPAPVPGDADFACDGWDDDAGRDVWWEVDYATKYAATMRRRRRAGGGPEERPPSWGHVAENVAELQYPEFIWPGWCGVDVTFLPPSAAADGAGGRGGAAPGKRFMHCTGVVTSRYAMDLPAMGGRRYVWQKTHRALEDGNGNGAGGGQGGQGGGGEKERLRRYYAATEKGGDGDQAATTAPQNAAPHGSAAGALFASDWTPFSPLYLVDAPGARHVLARYTRSAPWARARGVLEVFPRRRGDAGDPPAVGAAAFVEGVAVACAAMVGMQDRLGLAASLVEAGAESYAGKGKGRA